MNKNDNYSEFNNASFDEFNSCCNENNNVLLTNDHTHTNNETKERGDIFVKKKNTHLQFLIHSLVFVTAVALVIEPAFNISIVGYIFNQTQPATQQASVSYSSEATTVSYKDITYTIKIDNDDDNLKEYSLILVKQGCDNETYIDSLSANDLGFHSVSVTNKTTTHTFNTYITPSGCFNLLPDSNYVLLVIKDGEIVDRCHEHTYEFTYINSLAFTPSSGSDYINITVDYNDFDFDYLYIEITADDGTFLTYMHPQKSSMYPAFERSSLGLSSLVNINIYMLPLYGEVFETDKKMVFSGNTYYLIYTQESVNLSGI